jgi:plasmid stabilization system protein ParE
LFRVLLSPEARTDLKELHAYIAHRSTRRTAANYLRRLRKFSEELAIAPHCGEQREHLRPGLRSIGFEGRVSILFAVFDTEQIVEIESFLYGGRQDRQTPTPDAPS